MTATEEVRALAVALGKHQPNGWNRGPGKTRRPYRCRCGHTYNAGPDTGFPMHQAEVLRSLVAGMTVCDDCGGIGDDLCGYCDGTGKRGRGKCSACRGLGYMDCPTCYGVGVLSLEDAASRGWAPTSGPYGPGDDCQSCGIPASECGHVRPETPDYREREA